MAGIDPGAARASPAGGRSELWLRVASAAALAPLAVAAAYVGGAWFLAFWLLASAGVLGEWIGLVMRASLAWPDRTLWLALGVAYAGAMLAAPAVLRADAELGFVAIVFLFAVVWATDIGAYFVGRLAGGPKLWRSISPNKTWSGAVGGGAAAIVAGLGVAGAAGLPDLPAIAAVSLGLAILAAAGDLAESAFKRRFGAKNTGHLIPGHGGLMDRLDGFWAAAVAGAIIGAARGGIDGAARGLVVW